MELTMIEPTPQTSLKRKFTPEILICDAGGNPVNWVDYERACLYYENGKVLWEMGNTIELHGGINAASNKRSVLELHSIVGIKEARPRRSTMERVVPTAQMLYNRDNYTCAYCGFKASRREEVRLSKDHVHPRSKGGRDTWDNLITSCKTCNWWKDDKTLSEADMELRFKPYTPTHPEFLMIRRKDRMLEEQLDYLMTVVPNRLKGTRHTEFT